MHWGRRAWTRLSALINRDCGPSEMQPGWSTKDFHVRWSDCAEAAGRSALVCKIKKHLSAQTLRGDVWVALIGKWLEKPRKAAALAISSAWRSTFSSDPSLFSAAPALHNYHHQLAACTVMTPWFLQACLSRLRNMISSEELPVGILIPIHLRRCKANVNLAAGLTTSHNEESAHHQQSLLFADWFGLDRKTVI